MKPHISDVLAKLVEQVEHNTRVSTIEVPAGKTSSLLPVTWRSEETHLSAQVEDYQLLSNLSVSREGDEVVITCHFPELDDCIQIFRGTYTDFRRRFS